MEPVDCYAVWCENMADRSATSSTAIQGDGPGASESMEPADNPVNSESDFLMLCSLLTLLTS